MNFAKFVGLISLLGLGACAAPAVNDATPEQAARIDRKLVKDALVFEPGTKEGAIIPEISAPSLRAIWVEEKRDGNRLLEAHREWILEGDVSLLGIPKKKAVAK